jgi:anti-sigma B factor antagonist
MEFVKERKQGVVIYRVHQERLDTTVAPELKAYFLMSIEAGEKNFLLDLSAVKYADSSGLGALLLGLRQARDNGGDMKIFAVAPRVRKLIEIAHLFDHLQCYEDQSSALKAFAESSENQMSE